MKLQGSYHAILNKHNLTIILADMRVFINNADNHGEMCNAYFRSILNHGVTMRKQGQHP